MSMTTIVLVAWAVSASLMFLLWLRQVQTCNAGIVDVAWALLTPALAAWLVLADEVTNGTRQYLVIVLSMAWGIRLGFYLYKRIGGEIEDGRYRYLREHCGKYAQPVMFIFFQLQALVALLFALPFWSAARNTGTTFGPLDYAGIALWLIAISGEWLSDWQLARFKRFTRDRALVCRDGLWKYSRHPNYFFEWLHWWTYVLIGYGSDYWFISWAGVVLMYIFITRLTGVPYVEQQSLRSKGEAYRFYQKTTSEFFPMPPRVADDGELSGQTQQGTT